MGTLSSPKHRAETENACRETPATEPRVPTKSGNRHGHHWSFPVTPPSAKEENYVLGSPGSFPGGSAVKNLPAMQELVGSILGSGRSPGGRHGNSLQYSCLGNPMDRGARQATVYGDHKLSS